MAKTFKSISIDTDNYEDLMAIAAQLSDKLKLNVSINAAIGVLVDTYKNSDQEA